MHSSGEYVWMKTASKISRWRLFLPRHNTLNARSSYIALHGSFSTRWRAIADWYVLGGAVTDATWPWSLDCVVCTGWLAGVADDVLHLRGGPLRSDVAGSSSTPFREITHTACSLPAAIFRGLPRLGLNDRALDGRRCNGTCWRIRALKHCRVLPTYRFSHFRHSKW